MIDYCLTNVNTSMLMRSNNWLLVRSETSYLWMNQSVLLCRHHCQ